MNDKLLFAMIQANKTKNFSGGIVIRGTVDHVSDLPETAGTGDAYIVKFDEQDQPLDAEYVYTPDGWTVLGQDLSNYVEKTDIASTDSAGVVLLDGESVGTNVFGKLVSPVKGMEGKTVTVGSGSFTCGNGSAVINTPFKNGGSPSMGNAIGSMSTAMGSGTVTYDFCSKASGMYTVAKGAFSTAEGQSNPIPQSIDLKTLTAPQLLETLKHNQFSIAYGTGSHVDGNNCAAIEMYATAKGTETVAYGAMSSSEGSRTYAVGAQSHIEGISTSLPLQHTTSTNADDILEKWNNNRGSSYSAFSVSLGTGSHVEGLDNIAYGAFSHAGGNATRATGAYSFTSGKKTSAGGESSVAFGENSNASGKYASAFGVNTNATGYASTACGNNTYANGSGSFACGYSATTSNDAYTSAAFGGYVAVNNSYSLAVGEYLSTSNDHQLVIGVGNNAITNRCFIIGNGSQTSRHNAFEIDKTGKIYVNGSSVGVDVSSLNTSVNTLHSRVTTVDSRVTGVNNTVTSLNTTVTSLNTKVNGIVENQKTKTITTDADLNTFTAEGKYISSTQEITASLSNAPNLGTVDGFSLEVVKCSDTTITQKIHAVGDDLHPKMFIRGAKSTDGVYTFGDWKSVSVS